MFYAGLQASKLIAGKHPWVLRSRPGAYYFRLAIAVDSARLAGRAAWRPPLAPGSSLRYSGKRACLV